MTHSSLTIARLARICSLALIVLLLPATVSWAQPNARPMQTTAPADIDLSGLWKAKRFFGPDERGTLILQRTSRGWFAEFVGRRFAVEVKDGVLSFALPADRGSFRAKLNSDRSLSAGQWFQPESPVEPPFGSNIVFRQKSEEQWEGEVQPVLSQFTLYLMLDRRADGTYGAFIRNPERNVGVFLGVERLERDGDALRLMGKRLGRSDVEQVVSGTFDRERQTMRLVFSDRGGGAYDFHRESEDDSTFWPRGRRPGTYSYRAPLAVDDGWPVATAEDENLDRAGIEAFVQYLLDMPMDSTNALEVHGILVARHGRLVLEEYFHGFDRTRLHDTRSAGKSITATLAGAVMQAGLPVRLTDPVYKVINGGSFPAELEPRKRAMQLQHLLTMSSGIHCDDSEPTAPGNEERMLDQSDDKDYWRYYMAMPMDRVPGERSIYCSGDPNLAIGVLTRATGEHAMDLFDRYVARPLKISRYAWFLSPSLQPYGGGSVQILPRDFLKIGQMMANGGTWGGRRVLSEDFVRRASANLCPLNRIGYGYLWWSINFPYKDRTVRAYFAGGNGGQGIFAIPELDLVIGTFGGSYNSRAGLEIQQGLIPRYILPAVREKGERGGSPVRPRQYELIYGRERPAPACPQSAFQ
jgi:CubicO group peptidase (beta-lactamase class C family)